MRCESVQGLWSFTSPPLHHVVATTLLTNHNHTFSLYTGGSDGVIVWWKISSSSSPQQEIWPMAMLCGHASSVADLGICKPGKGTHSLIDKSLPSEISEALISASVDGVLCTWSSLTGHCRRRRKMPPWVGSPSVLSCLPKSRQYVCIACTCATAGQAQTCHATEVTEVGNVAQRTKEAALEREGSFKRTSKGAIVIVDSLTLNILQVIFHGFLSIGPVNSMVVVPDMISEKTYLLVSDLLGRMQCFALGEDNGTSSEAANFLLKGDCLHAASIDSANVIGEAESVSIAPDGKLVLLVSRYRWIIRSGIEGCVLIDESCINSLLCGKGTSDQSYLTGGMFLAHDSFKCDELKVSALKDNIVHKVVIWNNQGAAVIYAILNSGQSSYAKGLFQVPPVSSVLLQEDLCIKFDVMHNYLIRIESARSNLGLSVFPETHITIWSPSHLPCIQNHVVDDYQMAVMLGKGGLWGDWKNNEKGTDALEGKLYRNVKGEVDNAEYLGCLGRQTNSFNCSKGNDVILVERSNIVTSAMILSEKFSVPFALVYGFCSGEIELVKFECHYPFISTRKGKIQNKHDPSVVIQTFKGHTGPILCLAAQKVLVTGMEQESRHVLISGSADCTVRFWDLEGGSVLSVMHQHIAPVRQILLPAPWTERPWSYCLLTIADDACVSLSSLETLKVERMFPGHPSCPKMVAWDSVRGYIACSCVQVTTHGGHNDVLYIWDVKSGARERILQGGAAHSMFDHFLRCIHNNSNASKIFVGSTSASSLLFQSNEDSNYHLYGTLKLEKNEEAPAGSKSLSGLAGPTESANSTAKKIEGNFEKLSSKFVQAFGQGVNIVSSSTSSGNSGGNGYSNRSSSQQNLKSRQQPVKGVCPFPGVAALQFNLSSLMASDLGNLPDFEKHETKKEPDSSVGPSHTSRMENQISEKCSSNIQDKDPQDVITGTTYQPNGSVSEENTWLRTIEGYLLRTSLSFLHLWGADAQLDKLLMEDMSISKPEHVCVAGGLPGDRGSVTLCLPGWRATFELWKSSSEFCAMRSLTMVSLAQRIITLSRSNSTASSTLAAFYTRSLAERFPDIMPPLLELYICFWQDPSEHVRMAARSLFHCAAARAIPSVLRCERLVPTANSFSSSINSINDTTSEHEGMSPINNSNVGLSSEQTSQFELTDILNWLDSYEPQDWTSMIGGTDEDAKASHILVGAALAVWYPSLVKSNLAVAVAPQLVKLVMTMNGRHSPTAAELLAEGMDMTWQSVIPSEIPHLIGDVFLLIDCLSGGASTNGGSVQNPVMVMTIRDTLTGILLPSLAIADVLGFLHFVENQIWTTGSDSPVHLVSLMTLVRIIRGAPKSMVPCLDKVINYILHTMDTGNSVLRKLCLQSAMAALREMVRVFPMVALNQTYTRLAVGDAIGDICTLCIQVYDLQSVTKSKVLDASGPPGLPSLMTGNTAANTGGISALSFSPDGEGLVAFSHHGLMIRWWSLGAVWWEKLSRSTIPVQCTKLIFVPPWAGVSPNSSRASIMGCSSGDDSQNHERGIADEALMTNPAQNIDLSYRLEWKPVKKAVLLQHGQELGTFQL